MLSTSGDENLAVHPPFTLVFRRPNARSLVLLASTILVSLAASMTLTSPARSDVPGSLDAGFVDPNVTGSDGSSTSGSVGTMALQADGKILIGGAFGYVGGQARGNMARLNADGTLDSSFFNPSITDDWGFGVFSIAVQSNSKLVIGGTFSKVGDQPRNQVARLNPNGTLDSGFVSPDLTGGLVDAVKSVIVQPDGKILIGGTMTAIGGQPQTSVARLQANGTIDSTFLNPNINGWVHALAMQPDGKIVLGGNFSTVAGQPRRGLARLNPNGSLDATFNNANVVGPGVDSSIGDVNSIVIQSDGKVLVAGRLTEVGGQTRKGVARINANGTLDTSFGDPKVNLEVGSLALQEDGRILIGGHFTSVGGQEYGRLARLNADGTIDTTFRNPNADFYNINSVLLQPDGKILAGGDFTRIGGQLRNRVARLIAVDTTSPETTITNAPSGVIAANSASITFASSEPESTFSCSVDGSPFAACTSPLGLTALTVGEHSVAVRATDRAGNTDPTPATASWRVRHPDVTWENMGWAWTRKKSRSSRLSMFPADKRKLPSGHQIKVFCVSRCRSNPRRPLITLGGKKKKGVVGSFSKRGKRPVLRVVQGTRGRTAFWKDFEIRRSMALVVVKGANCAAQQVTQCGLVPAGTR